MKAAVYIAAFWLTWLLVKSDYRTASRSHTSFDDHTAVPLGVTMTF